jgi:isopenicillin N synthase-like dioxygenase
MLVAQPPLIDLAAQRDEVVPAVAAACAQWGFFQVINHGVPAPEIQSLARASAAFFAQDVATKRGCSRDLNQPWGYYDRELTKNLRDRKEIFDYGASGFVPWPAQGALRVACEAYSAHCHRLALRLLELCCAGLGLPDTALHAAFGSEHGSFTRLNYYPCEQQLLTADDLPAPGPLGISHHTDAGALTVLLQDAVAGLQVCRDDQWYTVEPIAGALTINVGDMLQVWSNDCYHAALHRVLASGEQPRFSTAYFLNPHYDCVVQPLGLAAGEAHYRPIPWREFRGLRAQGDYGDYGEEVQISHYRR